MNEATNRFPSARVVDANVLVKLFFPEPGWQIARALLRVSVGAAPAIRAIPEFTYLECANVFWKWVRRGLVPVDLARALLPDLLALPLQVWPVTELSEPALAVALALDVTVYDAAYLALADRLSIPLITADAALVQKAGGPSDRLRLLESFA